MWAEDSIPSLPLIDEVLREWRTERKKQDEREGYLPQWRMHQEDRRDGPTPTAKEFWKRKCQDRCETLNE
jgi:hypothetical protein